MLDRMRNGTSRTYVLEKIVTDSSTERLALVWIHVSQSCVALAMSIMHCCICEQGYLCLPHATGFSVGTWCKDLALTVQEPQSPQSYKVALERHSKLTAMYHVIRYLFFPITMIIDESFAQSCKDYQDYPKNLIQHHALKYSVNAYYDRLASENERLFNGRQAAVDFLDLRVNEQDYQHKPVSSFRELRDHLREAFPEGSDPRCRFVFLHAPHTRAPLRISLEMLNILFTYHQVMASFLDFVFPFGKQMYPKDCHFSGFREESRFSLQHHETRVSSLGRSGIGLRFCYNLRSVERSKNQSELPWSIRQTAVYHEFDIEAGRGLWIVVKGNKLIKNRILEASASPSLLHGNSRSEAFSASLSAHLLLCDWSSENWRWYINDMEDQLQALTRGVLAVRVDGPKCPAPSPVVTGGRLEVPMLRSNTFPMLSQQKSDPLRGISRTATGKFSFQSLSGSLKTKFPSRSPTLVCDTAIPSQQEDTPSEDNRPASSASDPTSHPGYKSAYPFFQARKPRPRPSVTKSWWLKRRQQSVTMPNIEMNVQHDQASLSEKVQLPIPREHAEGPHELHTFRDLQQIQFIEEKAQEALLVLKLNSEVLQELKTHYTYASCHSEFPDELKTKCQADLSRFNRCVSGVEKDFGMLQARTETLLSLLANRKSLLNGILQHRGTKQAQASADQMQRMTKEMHEIARKTKQETVSMRVITSVTLFFLPSTFIATFMSTDILKFEDGKSFFQAQGLGTYLAISLPLTILTFVAWYIIYLHARKRGVSGASRKEQVEDANTV